MRDEDPEMNLPSMRATDDDRVAMQAAERAAEPPLVRALREPAPRRQRNGALWAVCLSLLLALAGLGYWSHQQQSQLQRQLVATQESFARISEEAAGRLQTITGKVSATESTLSVAEKAQREQLRKLEQQLTAQQTTSKFQAEQLAALHADQQVNRQTTTQQQATLEQLSAVVTELPAQLQQLKTSAAERAAELQSAQQQLAEFNKQLQRVASVEKQLAEQAGQLQGLRQQLLQQQKALTEASRNTGSSTEQELLVLRSELEQSTTAINQSLESIDRFRLQTNRSISALNEQLTSMQRQLN